MNYTYGSDETFNSKRKHLFPEYNYHLPEYIYFKYMTGAIISIERNKHEQIL